MPRVLGQKRDSGARRVQGASATAIEYADIAARHLTGVGSRELTATAIVEVADQPMGVIGCISCTTSRLHQAGVTSFFSTWHGWLFDITQVMIL